VRIVVVGGSDAGISAALRARETDASADVTVLVADAFPSFSICGLPFFLSRETTDWRTLAHRSVDEIIATGTKLRLNTIATGIDPGARLVIAEGRDGVERLPYDAAIIATGATPARPPLEGLDLPGVHVLHTMEDGFSLNRSLEGATRALVVGGGYIGVELADALRRRELEVIQVEQLPQVMPTLDEEFGELVEAELARSGVDVRTGTRVGSIRLEGRTLSAHTDRGDISADVVVVAVGVRPDTRLASTAHVEIGAGDAISVDPTMRTSVDGVFAAGDCVTTLHALTRKATYLPLGTTAHKQGRVAGENAAGGDCSFAGSVGTQTVKVFDLAVARTGLRDAEAGAEGFQPASADIVVDDHKAYYPGSTPMHIRITGDRGTRRLLGAQIVGHSTSQASKRIDTFAVAVQHGWTVEALGDLDLSYTPPFSSPWDPVQLAALKWAASITD
jgi:NADPH-dependent 2,4-dienoyl-CoA reductase/sulfur reductase-like enzyme